MISVIVIVVMYASVLPSHPRLPAFAFGRQGLNECLEMTLSGCQDSASELVANFMSVQAKLPPDRQHELARRHMQSLFASRHVQRAAQLVPYAAAAWDSDLVCLEVVQVAMRSAWQNTGEDEGLEYLESLIGKMKASFQVEKSGDGPVPRAAYSVLILVLGLGVMVMMAERS